MQSQRAAPEEQNVKTETTSRQVQPGLSPRPGSGQPEAQPTASEAPPVVSGGNTRRVTGSADIPLNEEGRQQAQEFAQSHARADRTFYAPNKRSEATARTIDPKAKAASHLEPWPLAGHEGRELHEAQSDINELIRNPDTKPPGVSPHSGEPGESFNEVRRRLISGAQEQAEMMPHGSSVLNITSGRALQIIDAWGKTGNPAHNAIDIPTMTAEAKYPVGQIFHLGPDGLDPVGRIQPGQNYTVHASTDWNTSTTQNGPSFEGAKQEVPRETRGAVETQPLPLKPLHEMDREELDDVINRGSVSESNLLAELFGADARRYQRLERKANSSTDPQGADKAQAELESMEASLSPEQRDRLYGINQPEEHDLEQARSIRSAIGRVEGSTPQELGDSLKWAVSRFDPENPTANAEAYAQLRRGAQIARENGWNTSEVMASAYQGVAHRFTDPEDAAFMLERFRAAPAAGLGALQPPGARGSETEIHVEGRETPYKARYAVRELADTQPSHNPFSFERNPGEQAAADARSLTPNVGKYIATALEGGGADATLTDVLNSRRGPEIVNRLIGSGIFTEAERPELLDAVTGNVTSEAKTRIGKMLLGGLFKDSEAFQAAEPSLRNKLERVAGVLKQIEGRPGWDLTPDVKSAIEAMAYERDYKAAYNSQVGGYLEQNQIGMFGDTPKPPEVSPQARRLVEFFRDNNPTAIARAFRSYAEKSTAQSLFGDIDPRDAFESAFGRSSEQGAVSPEFRTLGVGKFIEHDVAPTLKDAALGLRDTTDDILKALAPTLRGGTAQAGCLIFRQRLGELARKTDQAKYAVRLAEKYFNRQSEEANFDFIDRMEHGQKQETPELDGIAKVLRYLYDNRRAAVQALGTGKLQKFYENYFAHIFEKPERAKTVFASFFGKRPLEGPKSFLKQRKYPTIADGRAAGLKPVSDNPVTLTLLKIHEMDRYVMAHQTLADWKEAGIARFVDAREGKPPAGSLAG
ncbi:MAG: histidine phosphatase family protein [Bryobacteraceae bacterium]